MEVGFAEIQTGLDEQSRSLQEKKEKSGRKANPSERRHRGGREITRSPATAASDGELDSPTE